MLDSYTLEVALLLIEDPSRIETNSCRVIGFGETTWLNESQAGSMSDRIVT